MSNVTKEEQKKEVQEMSFNEKVMRVQTELKAPKGQRNEFGKYNYRSCEDIFEAVKPLLAKYGLVLVVGDELFQIGDRIYIKATARLFDEHNDVIMNTAYAREEDVKKGMDGSQITGASSSYARKYALNGLFLIDDTKDSDATNTHGKDDQKSADAKEPVATPKQIEVLNKLVPDAESKQKMFDFIEKNTGIKYETVEDFPAKLASQIITMKTNENKKKEEQA